MTREKKGRETELDLSPRVDEDVGSVGKMDTSRRTVLIRIKLR